MFLSLKILDVHQLSTTKYANSQERKKALSLASEVSNESSMEWPIMLVNSASMVYHSWSYGLAPTLHICCYEEIASCWSSHLDFVSEGKGEKVDVTTDSEKTEQLAKEV